MPTSHAIEDEEVELQEHNTEDLQDDSADEPSKESGDESTDPLAAETEPDEVVIAISDEKPEESDEVARAPEWVRDLRKANREKERELRQMREELAKLKAPTQQPLGAEPSLEQCEYDTERYARELKAWLARKSEADAHAREQAAEQQRQQEAWQAKQEAYKAAKSKLKVADFDAAEDTVCSTLSEVQQSIILAGADNAAMVVAALGNAPTRLKTLADIKDPVRFAVEIGKLETKLETQLKTVARKSAPPPERAVRSTVTGAAAVDNQLEKLRAEAAKTGDMSKLMEYKRNKRK